jgi:hypothetical protein
MVQNSGPLIPDPNWLATEDTSLLAESYDRAKALDFARSEQHYLAKISRMGLLMHAWVGGTERPTEAAISKYYRFLKHCDALALWQPNIDSGCVVPLFRQDLGTLMNLNLLYAFAPRSESKVTTLLEIGGGYGRLAEAAFNIFGRTLQYVMVDAVPASLYYARKYLTYACPDARIGFYYDTGSECFDVSRYDIAIVPAWHFERLNTLRYDICVNIESMQEMNQDHVDYYLNLFQRVAADGATIYLSNAHDYYFRGSFNYPIHWQKLFCANTPRSWRSDHPTEVFRNTSCDCSMPNRVSDALHRYRLWLEDDPQEFVSRKGRRSLIAPLLRGVPEVASAKVRRLLGLMRRWSADVILKPIGRIHQKRDLSSIMSSNDRQRP